MQMGMDLIVTSGALATLSIEAARAHPYECCGLLFGARRIEFAEPALNVHSDPARGFEIDPQMLIAAHRATRQGGPRLRGYYHSHPRGPAEPSATDRAQASGDGLIWAIIASEGVTFWRDWEQGFEALPYRVSAE